MKEQLPAIGGSEGAGRIIKVGPGSKYAEGDLITLFNGIKTPFWTQYGIAPEEEVCKLDSRIPLDLAATFQINPPTAWVVLKKYVDLEKGDYVIQNAANSGVGRGVIQLCKAKTWGFKSINIVRNRKDIGLLKTELWNIGADHVFTEEEFEQQGRKFIKSLPSQPRLALNGVGGKSVLRIAAALERGGTCVTYGGMSKQAHQFPTSALVFNDIRVRGVAIGIWVRQGNQDEFIDCLNDLQKLAVEGKITAPPMDRILLEDFKTAINRTMDGGHPKQLLILHHDQAKI